jgi:hypothetical protein
MQIHLFVATTGDFRQLAEKGANFFFADCRELIEAFLREHFKDGEAPEGTPKMAIWREDNSGIVVS